MKQDMMEWHWQWHQADHTHIICTSFKTDNHASTSSLLFTDWMLFLTPNQQFQELKANSYDVQTVP